MTRRTNQPETNRPAMELYTLRQIGDILGLTVEQVRYRLRTYHISHLRVGRTYLARLEDFVYLPLWSRTATRKRSVQKDQPANV